MAANANNDKALEDLHTHFASLNEDLKRWYRACIQQRREIESRVQQCKKFLKPWPSPVKEKCEYNVQDSVQSTQDTSCMPIKDQDNTKPDPNMELLDKILAKAQKAREAQNKLDLLNSSSEAKKPIKTTANEAVEPKTKPSKKGTSKTTTRPADKTIQRMKSQPVAMATTSQTSSRPATTRAVVKQPVLLRKNKPAPMKTTYGATYGKVTSRPGTGSRVQPNKGPKDFAKHETENNTRPKSKTTEKTSPEPVTPTSQHNSTMNKEADFAERAKSELTRISNELKQIDARKQELSNQDESRTKTALSSMDENKKLFAERAKSELTRISTELKQIDARKQELSKREESKTKIAISLMDENKNETVRTTSEKFLLEEDGHSLVLPAKYRKLKSAHLKLISKLSTEVEKTDDSDNFVTRLERQFDFDEASDDLVKSKYISLVKKQRDLHVYAEWITQRSNAACDSSFSWQNVYKCYRHWQILLGKFRDLQKRTQELITAEEILQRWCPCGGCVSTRDRSSHFYKSHHTSAAKPLPASCTLFSTWLDLPSPHSGFNMEHITYRNEKELRMLNESVHNLEMSQVDLYVQNSISSKALDALERIDPSHRYFAGMYRTLWGLVCCDGKAFPSVVLDNTTD